MILEQEDRTKLRKFLVEHFSLDDLKSLASDLGLDYQTLPHETTPQLSLALIDYFEHREDITSLLNKVLALRPGATTSNAIKEMCIKYSLDTSRQITPHGMPNAPMNRPRRENSPRWPISGIMRIITLLLLLLSLLLITQPVLLPRHHVSPMAVRAMFIALLTLFLILLLMPQRNRVQIKQKQRAVYRAAQLNELNRTAVNRSARGLEVESNYVEPRLQQSNAIVRDGRVTEEWPPVRILRDAVMAEPERAGVVIWGMAGAGKTVLARWLARQIAMSGERGTWGFLQRRVVEEASAHGRKRLRVLDWRTHGLRWLGLEPSEFDLHYPYVFYVELQAGDFGDTVAPGTDAILDCLHTRIPVVDVQALARDKLILPIFDGLDQLDAEAQARFLKSLQKFLSDTGGNIPFILTSRQPLSNDDDTGLGSSDFPVSQWQVLPFSNSQVQKYIEQYYSRRNDLPANRTEALWRAIRTTAQASPKVWQLLTEPMIMSKIASIFDPRDPKGIDTDRVTIYEKYLAWLIQKQHSVPPKNQSGAARLDQQKKIKDLLGIVAHRGLLARRTVFSPAQMSAEERQAFEEFDGVLTLTWTNSGAGYAFSHTTMQSFFAAVYLADQLRSCAPDAVNDLWRETIGRCVAVAESRRPRDNSGDEQWRAHWRDVVTMTTGMLTPRDSTRTLEDAWIYQAVQWVRDGVPAPQGRVLFLRLLAAIQERTTLLPNAIGRGSIASWLSALARHKPLASSAWWYWQRDLGEVGELLTDDDWQELQRQASIPESFDPTLRLLSALRHERSAQIIIEIALGQCRTPQKIEDDLYHGRMTQDVKAALRQGCVAPQLQEALRIVGVLAVTPLVRAYHRAEWDYREALRTGAAQPTRETLRHLGLLLEMMGYAGYTQELNAILNPNAAGHAVLETLTPVAYLALARWGMYGIAVLESLLRDADRSSPAQRVALALALAEAPLEGDLPEQYRWRLGQECPQRMLVVEVIQEKLKQPLSPSDRRTVEALFQRDQNTYAASAAARWRHILRWLEGRFLGQPVRPGFDLWRWLHGGLRDLSAPTPLRLKSMLQISGGVDCEISQRWILSALKDPCLEASRDAEDAFAALSMQYPADPYWLWNKIRGDLRLEVNARLKDRLDQEVRCKKEQAAISPRDER